MRCRAGRPRGFPGRCARWGRTPRRRLRLREAPPPLHAARDHGDAAGARLDSACPGLSPRGSPLAKLRALRALALPLVLSALHEVDERALALETRGMVGVGKRARRTPLAPPPDSRRQRAMRWGMLAVAVVALALRLAWRG